MLDEWDLGFNHGSVSAKPDCQDRSECQRDEQTETNPGQFRRIEILSLLLLEGDVFE
jgi:hypothetical protein